MNSTFFWSRDTITVTPSGTAAVLPVQNDTATGLRKFSNQEVDDIFSAMERRERELDSIARVRAYHSYLRSIRKPEPKGFDTASVPYNVSRDTMLEVQNPLGMLGRSYFSSKDTMKPVFLESRQTTELPVLEESTIKSSYNSVPSHNLRPDWLLAVIIGSLVLLAWLKLFFNKFLDQTIQSVGNYQLSTKLLRDQNIFSRRVAFALNLNFVLVGASFIYLVFGFFNLRLFLLGDFLSYLSYAGIISVLLILRYIVSHIIGHVFNKQHEFKEYLHQLLLIYKNLGIYLLILVIGIAYIREDLRIYLVYSSGLLLAAALILRMQKGVKIILINKDFLIFYLILYLCTLEILPLLIFYRVFSSSVLTG